MYILYLQIIEPTMKALYEEAVQKRRDDFKTNKKYMDAGFDLYMPKEQVWLANETLKTRLGVRCAAVRQTFGSASLFAKTRPVTTHPAAFYMYPRSSLSKTPLRLANSVGIIDAGYRGELMAALDNRKADGSYAVGKGQRLVQICMPNLEPFQVQLVDSLDETERGEGGFGSTGA
tara:strand:+ start:873 stop:1397 length:525 start_codon:yes stop_codon:yes gene_type:complete